MIYPLKIVIFHSYVSLPEGIQKKNPKMKKNVWFGTVKSSKSFKFIGYIMQNTIEYIECAGGPRAEISWALQVPTAPLDWLRSCKSCGSSKTGTVERMKIIYPAW